MNSKKAVYLSALIVFLLISITSLCAIFVTNIKYSKSLERKIKTQDEIILYLENEVKDQNLIIQSAHNSIVKFEMIIGVEEPDGIITYKEKCLITAKRMNKLNKAKL